MLHERGWLERARKKVQKCLLWPKEISKMESLGPTYQPPWEEGESYRLPPPLLKVTCRVLFSALYSKLHPTPVLGVPTGWGPPC